MTDGSLGVLSGIKPNTLDGYSLQATPGGDVGFLADGGIYIGSADSPTFNILQDGAQIQASINGDTKNVILSKFDDLLISPDGTIYFEAEAEIRELPFPFESANFLWRLEEGGVPQAIVQSGKVAIEVEGGNDILFDDRFSLRDANKNGQLVFTARLDDSNLDVNSGSDDALFVFESDPLEIVDGSLVLLAREGDSIPLRPEQETYGVPQTKRGATISDDGSIVFRAADPGVFFEPNDDAVLVAKFLTGDTIDFVWSGACGGDNWHDDCFDSNWNDSRTGDPAEKWPGDASGTETAFIGNASVRIIDQAVDIRSLTATGSLTVEQPLTLREESTIENLTMRANVTSTGGLTLNEGTVHSSGKLTVEDATLTATGKVYSVFNGEIESNGTLTNKGTFSKRAPVPE